MRSRLQVSRSHGGPVGGAMEGSEGGARLICLLPMQATERQRDICPGGHGYLQEVAQPAENVSRLGNCADWGERRGAGGSRPGPQPPPSPCPRHVLGSRPLGHGHGDTEQSETSLFLNCRLLCRGVLQAVLTLCPLCLAQSPTPHLVSTARGGGRTQKRTGNETWQSRVHVT